MPTYTYRCTKCGEEIEAFQSMSDPPLKRCKLCRGALRRTFHPVGIVLKGPGFHRTDYRSKPKGDGGESKKSEGADKADKKEATAGAEKKTAETKTDKKASSSD